MSDIKQSWDDGCDGPSVLSRLASGSSNVRAPIGMSRRTVQLPFDTPQSTVRQLDEGGLVEEFLSNARSQRQAISS